MSPWFLLLAVALQSLPTPPKSASATVTVDVRSQPTRPVTPGAVGFNVALMESGISYRDRALASAARSLNAGWLRFPAGMRSDAYDWTTGLSRQEWVDRFAGSEFQPRLQEAHDMLAWKGGEKLDDAAAFARDVGARGLIVCVNVFTDTPESAGKLAAYARANRISVLAWELGNEPTFFPTFFPTATAYAARMRPFADAIRAVDPIAPIALSLSISGLADSTWDNALAEFRPRFWNRLALHYYPQVVGPPAELEARHAALLADVAPLIERDVIRRFGAMPVLITEARPTMDLVGTLYAGVWAAELALRLSGVPAVERLGIHQLLGPGGIELTRNHASELQRHYERTRAHLPEAREYGPFLSAQGVAYGVAAGAVNASTVFYPTTTIGGRRVARVGSGDSLPLIFAQAFGAASRREVVLTNRSATSESVRIVWDGEPVAATFVLVTATGSSAETSNSPGQPRVAPVRSQSRGLVRLPPYSVVRVSWPVASPRNRRDPPPSGAAERAWRNSWPD